MPKTAISPTRAEDYPNWYQAVVKHGELAEHAVVRGCMVIKPWGYGIWEQIKQDLDARFKATGHVNAYFPLLIPLSYLEKEAEHVSGFAKECAVVTHHRLVTDPAGGLKPDGALDEPYVIRPTSETIIGACFAKWVDSYRDLPLKVNQWANVMRWEMRTRLFLRTSEFLWQEGHTVHATETEAMTHTRTMLSEYAAFAEEVLAMPVVAGEKTKAERFPGAVNTYCIEALMQDLKALQAGTSHFLGQNFAKASGIQFNNAEGERVHAWTTSWGVSTRLIGGMVMTHADDNGLILPPRVAPQHVVIMPIHRRPDERAQVMAFCEAFAEKLRACVYAGQPVRVHMDDRDINGGEKTWQWIKKGIPLRIEVGPRDLAKGAVFVGRRDVGTKESMQADDFLAALPALLANIQQGMKATAAARLQAASHHVHDLASFEAHFAPDGPGGFVYAHAADTPAMEEAIQALKVTARCIPFDANPNGATQPCIFTSVPTQQKILFAKAY